MCSIFNTLIEVCVINQLIIVITRDSDWCSSVLQDVTCSAGQTCVPLLVPGCDGVQCQKYTEQCTGFDQFCFCSNCSGLTLKP